MGKTMYRLNQFTSLVKRKRKEEGQGLEPRAFISRIDGSIVWANNVMLVVDDPTLRGFQTGGIKEDDVCGFYLLGGLRVRDPDAEKKQRIQGEMQRVLGVPWQEAPVAKVSRVLEHSVCLGQEEVRVNKNYLDYVAGGIDYGAMNLRVCQYPGMIDPREGTGGTGNLIVVSNPEGRLKGMVAGLGELK